MENNLENVSPEWVRKEMERLNIQVRDMVKDTGISSSNISCWIHGRRNMTKPVKALFYFYFKTLSLCSPIKC